MGVTFIAPQGTYTAPAKLVTKEITENGTYDATDDSANGYSSVTVNVEGGGGSWQTVFEGSVTTEPIEDTSLFGITLSDGLRFNQDIIRVTLNDVEYECEKIIMDGNTGCAYGGYTGEGGEPDFSQYPFVLVSVPLSPNDTDNTFLTQTAGTYTLKIEEPQSGGSSDFSTAQVTIVNGSESAEIPVGVGAFAMEDQEYTTAIILDSTHGMQPITEDAFPVADSLTTTYVLITNKGMIFSKLHETRNVYAITGNAEIIDVGTDKHPQIVVKVSGDCTITIS